MEFSIACSEIYYLFTNLKEDELKKIPKKLIELICLLKIDDHISTIDINKPLEEQQLSETTKELISFIYNKYLGTKEENNQNTNNHLKTKKISFEENDKKEKKSLIKTPQKANIFWIILKKIKNFFKIK